MSVPSNWNAAITENVAPIDNKNNASCKNYKKCIILEWEYLQCKLKNKFINLFPLPISSFLTSRAM